MMYVEVITPEKTEFQGEADQVVLPTMKGEITILQDHAPIISVLRPGKARIRMNGKETEFPISGGVVEVEQNRVNILLKQFHTTEPV